MLRRLAAEPVLTSLSSGEPVLQLVMEVAFKTQLTEVEVVVWAIHLTTAKLALVKWQMYTVLLVSAYYVKEGLEGDLKEIYTALERRDEEFRSHLEMWKQLHPRKDPSFQEVLLKWRHLKRPISDADLAVINYNYCVDDLLQASTAPVDSFTGGTQRQTIWRPEELRYAKPLTTPLAAYETAEEFPLPWFDSVPLSPGLLFFNFTPPTSAMLRTEDYLH